MEDSPRKRKVENQKKRKGKTKKQKKSETKFQKKERRCFFKRRRNEKQVVQEFYTKERDVKHNSNFSKHFRESRHSFFQKWTKKESQKKTSDSSKRRFFLLKKSGKDKKNWRCES